MADGFDEVFDRARRALDAGSVEHALVAATDAVKLAPTRSDARLLLARIWLLQGRADRALSDARSAVELGGATLPAEAARQADDVIARAALSMGDTATAEPALRRLVAPPGDAAAFARLVWLLAATARREEAAEMAVTAARAHLEYEPAFGSVARALDEAGPGAQNTDLAFADLELDLGMFDGAKARYQAVLAREPESERAADGLRAVARGGDPKRAAEARKAALGARSGGFKDPGPGPWAKMIQMTLFTVGVMTTLSAKYAPLPPELALARKNLLFAGCGLMLSAVAFGYAGWFSRRQAAAATLPGKTT